MTLQGLVIQLDTTKQKYRPLNKNITYFLSIPLEEDLVIVFQYQTLGKSKISTTKFFLDTTKNQLTRSNKIR